jgi:uncharacterized membrane protein YoaK (UPF0700 family)
MLYNAKTWNISFVAVSGNVFVFAGPDFLVLFLASLCVLLSVDVISLRKDTHLAYGTGYLTGTLHDLRQPLNEFD